MSRVKKIYTGRTLSLNGQTRFTSCAPFIPFTFIIFRLMCLTCAPKKIKKIVIKNILPFNIGKRLKIELVKALKGPLIDCSKGPRAGLLKPPAGLHSVSQTSDVARLLLGGRRERYGGFPRRMLPRRMISVLQLFVRAPREKEKQKGGLLYMRKFLSYKTNSRIN